MAKTAWERFKELVGSQAMTASQMEAAGIKYADSYLSQWRRMTPPRVAVVGYDNEGRKLFAVAVAQAPTHSTGDELDAVPSSVDDVGADNAVHVLKGHNKDDAPAPAPTQPEAVKPSTSMDELVMQLADKLAQSIALQVQARLEDYLTQAIEAKLAPLPEAVRMDVELPLPTAPVKHKGEKLHVCIGGLLPQQAHLIQKEFGADMQIDFLGSDHNAKSVQEKLSHADAAFVMTKFIGHWLDRKFAEAKVPVFQRINGGMTRLRDCLTSLYVSS